jgi:hypothetical protein
MKTLTIEIECLWNVKTNLMPLKQGQIEPPQNN